MKTKKSFFRFRTAAAVATLSVVGVTVTACVPEEPAHVAVVAGARQAVPALFDRSDPQGAVLQLPSFASALSSAASHDLNVTILTVDGDPFAATSLSLKVDRANPRTIDDSVARNTTMLAEGLLSAHAKTPESNIVAALDMAGRSVGGQNSPSIYILDSGISTTGPLIFQNGLIGPKTNVDTVIAQLRTAGNLPSLSGVKIRWWGLGQVDGPQTTPPVWAKDKLKALYTALITASGGTVDFYDESIPPATGPSNLPAVTPVVFSDTVAEPVSVSISDDRLRFVQESADFADVAGAASIIDSLAAQLAHTQHGIVYVTGCTALPPGSSPERLAELSKLRADAVTRELAARGITGLNSRGFGADCPGRIPDIALDGTTVIPTAQAQNRKVLLTTIDFEPVPAK